ncbi:hypothetical protein RIF29_42036 [Crotalaria pallida]|uniref:Uncharacterized protein n=1 Tax=Crotalaria pallida TaxID=3830 RepID=A0AAN9E668_CROPI
MHGTSCAPPCGTIDHHNDKISDKKLVMGNVVRVERAGSMDLNIDGRVMTLFENSCTFGGYKLFGVDLQMRIGSGEQHNSVLKTGVVNTSNAIMSSTDQSSRILKFGFKSRVKFYSILDPARICHYISEVSDAGFLGPLFKHYGFNFEFIRISTSLISMEAILYSISYGNVMPIHES